VRILHLAPMAWAKKCKQTMRNGKKSLTYEASGSFLGQTEMQKFPEVVGRVGGRGWGGYKLGRTNWRCLSAGHLAFGIRKLMRKVSFDLVRLGSICQLLTNALLFLYRSSSDISFDCNAKAAKEKSQSMAGNAFSVV